MKRTGQARRARGGIAGWRLQIDRIDDRLVALLNERAACAIEIGKLKRARNLPIHVPEREMEVLRRASAGNRGPLSREAIRRLFERIVDESRSIERSVAESAGSMDSGGPMKRPHGGRKREEKGRLRRRWSS